MQATRSMLLPQPRQSSSGTARRSAAWSAAGRSQPDAAAAHMRARPRRPGHVLARCTRKPVEARVHGARDEGLCARASRASLAGALRCRPARDAHGPAAVLAQPKRAGHSPHWDHVRRAQRFRAVSMRPRRRIRASRSCTSCCTSRRSSRAQALRQGGSEQLLAPPGRHRGAGQLRMGARGTRMVSEVERSAAHPASEAGRWCPSRVIELCMETRPPKSGDVRGLWVCPQQAARSRRQARPPNRPNTQPPLRRLERWLQRQAASR